MNQAVKTIMEEKSDSEDIKSINQVVQKKFLDERKIFLWGEVNDKSCRDVTERLFYLETTDPGKEIILYLNSPGGSVDAGMAVFDTMELISSPITVVVTAMAASMGSILLCAASKGQRLLYPHARVMIHQPLIGGQMMGAAVDINIYAQEMEKTREEINRILSKSSGQPLEKVQKDTDRDFYMNAQETIDYGLADKIVNKV